MVKTPRPRKRSFPPLAAIIAACATPVAAGGSVGLLMACGSVSLLTACGKITLNGAAPNDPTPTGSIIVQGQLQGENGKTVSGSATIYGTGLGDYTLQLSGISVPNESGLQVEVVPQSGTSFTVSLRATSGTQNYPITNTGAQYWKKVRIYSVPNGIYYATALLL